MTILTWKRGSNTGWPIDNYRLFEPFVTKLAQIGFGMTPALILALNSTIIIEINIIGGQLFLI